MWASRGSALHLAHCPVLPQPQHPLRDESGSGLRHPHLLPNDTVVVGRSLLLPRTTLLKPAFPSGPFRSYFSGFFSLELQRENDSFLWPKKVMYKSSKMSRSGRQL